MIYKVLTIVLVIVMGLVIHDLYTLLENQEEIYSAIHNLRYSTNRQLLLTR
jgi:hypothetical protein